MVLGHKQYIINYEINKYIKINNANSGWYTLKGIHNDNIEKNGAKGVTFWFPRYLKNNSYYIHIIQYIYIYIYIYIYNVYPTSILSTGTYYPGSHCAAVHYLDATWEDLIYSPGMWSQQQTLTGHTSSCVPLCSSSRRARQSCACWEDGCYVYAVEIAQGRQQNSSGLPSPAARTKSKHGHAMFP